MIKGSEFIGTPILKINNELLDYYVKDLIYCSKKLKILGFLVQKHLRSKDREVIIYKNVKDVNANGIVISTKKQIIAPEQVPEIENALKKPAAIIGFEIHGINGDLVGVVKDTVIELKSGKILGLIISEGVLTDLFNGYSIIPLSQEIDFDKKSIVIDKVIFEETMEYQEGGLKKMFGIEHRN